MGRAASAAALAVLVAIVAVIVVVATRHATRPECAVNAVSGDGRYTFTPEQTANAATIAAVGRKLGLPAHAATVAIATALQESKLRNLDGGDRDSIGLFQQRPSQGWGEPAQLQDPVFAATAFYRKLVELPDWQSLPITVAAQDVQRSDLPDAYARWEPQSRALAAALSGQFPAALTCRHLHLSGADTALADIAENQLGTAQLSGPHPADEGWTIAHWLVAHAADLGVDRVAFDGHVWTAASGAWQPDATVPLTLSLHRPESKT